MNKKFKEKKKVKNLKNFQKANYFVINWLKTNF